MSVKKRIVAGKRYSVQYVVLKIAKNKAEYLFIVTKRRSVIDFTQITVFFCAK